MCNMEKEGGVYSPAFRTQCPITRWLIDDATNRSARSWDQRMVSRFLRKTPGGGQRLGTATKSKCVLPVLGRFFSE